MLRHQLTIGVAAIVVSWLARTAQQSSNGTCSSADKLDCRFSKTFCKWSYSGWYTTHGMTGHFAKRNNQRRGAILTSPVVCSEQQNADQYCLQLDYYLRSGQIEVYIQYDSITRPIFTQQDEEVSNVSMDITQAAPFRIFIHGKNLSENADVRIYDVKFHNSTCQGDEDSSEEEEPPVTGDADGSGEEEPTMTDHPQPLPPVTSSGSGVLVPVLIVVVCLVVLGAVFGILIRKRLRKRRTGHIRRDGHRGQGADKAAIPITSHIGGNDLNPSELSPPDNLCSEIQEPLSSSRSTSEKNEENVQTDQAAAAPTYNILEEPGQELDRGPGTALARQPQEDLYHHLGPRTGEEQDGKGEEVGEGAEVKVYDHLRHKGDGDCSYSHVRRDGERGPGLIVIDAVYSHIA